MIASQEGRGIASYCLREDQDPAKRFRGQRGRD